MMKKLILSILLVLCMCFQASAFNPLVVCGGGVAAEAGGCSEAENEINSARDTTYGSSFTQNANVNYTYLFTADCTGSLGTAYIYTDDGSGTANAKVCVYAEGDADTTPDTADTGVDGGSAACTGAISEAGGVGWKSGAFSTGTVTEGSSYWITIMVADSGWNHTLSDTATVWYREDAAYYGTPPDNIDGYNSSVPDAGPVSVYVTIAAGFTCSGDSGLLCDTFDGGSTTCGDDASSQENCWEDWVVDGATINNQATGLEGTYAKSIICPDWSSSKSTKNTFTANSTVYAFTRWQADTIAAASDASKAIIYMASEYGDSKCIAGIKNSSGTHYFYTSTAADVDVSALTPAAGTEYWLWLEAANGGNCTLYASATSTKPAATVASVADNSSSNKYMKIYFYAHATNPSNDTVDNVFIDKVRIRATPAYGDDGE